MTSPEDTTGAHALLDELRELGVQLWATDGRIRFRAPRGVLTDRHRNALRDSRETVLGLLADETAQAAVTADPEAAGDPFPLTDVQGAYLVGRHDSFGYGGVACCGYQELHYPRLDPVRLERAWNRLVARHGMLRAVIETDGSQRVLDDVDDYHVAVADLRDAGPEQLDAHLAAVRAELDHRMPEPDRWPLFELRVTRAPAETIVHLALDSLICDWGSAGVLLDELDVLLGDPDAALPPLAIGFRDYVLAERRLRDGDRYERDRAYWWNRIDELPAAPELPVLAGGRPGDRQAGQVRFQRYGFRLSPQRTAALRERVRQHGLTDSTVLLTAYATVLQRWSRQDRFTLDLTVLDRRPLHPDVAGLVGDFTSVTLVEVSAAGGHDFAVRARAMHERVLTDLDHGLCSGIEVLRELSRRRGRDEARMPVVFTSGLGTGPGASSDRGQGRTFGYGLTQTPQVLLDCQVNDSAGGLAVNWDVRDGVFPPGLVEDMNGAYRELLERLADDETAWDGVEEVPEDVPLPAWQVAERRQVNDTAASLPRGSLHKPVLERATRQPDAPAVIDARRVTSYGELVARAGGVARALADSGCGAGDRVAVVMEKGVEQIAAVLGVLCVGAAYVPVDATQPAARREHMLAGSGARVALTQSWLDLADELSVPTVAVDTLTDAPVEPAPAEAARPEDLAYVIYTSGSTGTPKGVMITHAAARNTIEDITRLIGLNEHDRVLGLAELGFDLSVYDVFGTLAAGATLVLTDPDRRGDPSHWRAAVLDHGVTVWNSVPAQLQMLATYLETDPAGLSTMRTALLSGDWIPVNLPDQIRMLLPGLELHSLGGATEAAIWSIHHRIDDVDPTLPSIPYGTPLANQGFRVLDRQLRDAPVWVTGELAITGEGLALGYLGDETLTAQRFVHHPVDGQRLYRTGDLGRYLPGGEIEFQGRDDGQVKLRGHRIELGEVETALLAHPGVETAAAVVSGTPGVADGDRRLLAFVTAARAETRGERGDVVAAAARTVAADVAPVGDVAVLNEHIATVTEAAELSMLYALDERGALVGEPRSAEIVRAAGVADRHEWLVRCWLDVLVRDGRLIRDAATGCHARAAGFGPVSREQVDAAWRHVHEASVSQLSTPDYVDYLTAHVDRIHALLEGKQDPFALLFPEGRLDVARAVYRDDIAERYVNAAGAAAVAAAVGEHGDRPVRLLEIGAGTGALTDAAVAALSEQSQSFASAELPLDYLVTDINPLFPADARDRFADRTGMRFGVFDIDRDYRAQGLEPNTFDVVLCAGVLSSTADSARAIGAVVELLAPGGWLIVTEPVGDEAHILLTQGFMLPPEGGDHVDGATPFRSVAGWRELFEASGVDVLACLPEDEHPLAAQGMRVFVGQAKTDRARLTTDEVGAFVASRLPAPMVPAAVQLVDALPVTANGKVDRKLLATWTPAEATELGTDTDAERSTTDSELTRRLTTLWAGVLGLARLGPDESLVERGADSLVMARVAGQLRTEIAEAAEHSYDVLLRRMLNRPSVAALAEFLESADDTAVAEVAEVDDAARNSDEVAVAAPRSPQSTSRARSNALLVPFGGAGDSTRVLFHAALGTMDFFQRIGAALAEQELGPVVGVAVEDAERYCLVSPEELIGVIADDYARRLLDEGHTRIQLVGYCLGGLVATEVARLLAEHGVPAVDLTLIDSIPMLVRTDEELLLESVFVPNLNLDPVAAVFGEGIPAEDVYRAMDVVRAEHDGAVPAGALGELDGDPGLAAVAAAARARTALGQQQRLAGYAKAAAAQAGLPVQPELVPALFRVCRHSTLAAQLRLEPYLGDMTFLRATESRSFGLSAEGITEIVVPYWEDACFGELSVHDVPGDHLSVIEPPQLATVVDHLARPLRQGTP